MQLVNHFLIFKRIDTLQKKPIFIVFFETHFFFKNGLLKKRGFGKLEEMKKSKKR